MYVCTVCMYVPSCASSFFKSESFHYYFLIAVLFMFTRELCMSQIQEWPPPPATPGHLTRIKSRVGGNLTFVQVPVPRAFDTMKKNSQHFVYPNNIHQYQSRQQCKGLFSILFCNHVSSVKYRKQEQIFKILDTMNQWSQFYNVLKYQ